MPAETVENDEGLRCFVGQRVFIYRFGNEGVYGTVMARNDRRYTKRYNTSYEYIPVVHDDGFVNGYKRAHMTFINPSRIALDRWLDKSDETV